MTKHIVQLPNPDGSLLLRELNHRIKNELTSAIYAVSAKAVQSDSVAVKVALLDVVDPRHFLRALISRRLLMERRTMFARSGTAESDLYGSGRL